jgi:uncharacterized protein YxjI
MSEYHIKLRAKLEQLKAEGHIYREVDGFYVYNPGDRPGSFTGNQLQAIADYLAELNRAWEIQIRMDLGPEIAHRIRVTFQAEMHNLIDKETLIAEYGGDLMQCLHQMFDNDGLVGYLSTDLVAIKAEELFDEIE